MHNVPFQRRGKAMEQVGRDIYEIILAVMCDRRIALVGIWSSQIMKQNPPTLQATILHVK